MRSAVLLSPKKIEVQEIEIPKVAKDEVLIKTKACAICTADRRVYSSISKISYPAILGHEVSGVIENIGTKNTNFSIGDHVAAGGRFAYSCGYCAYCKMGFRNQCTNLKMKKLKSGELLLFGGFGQYFTFPIKGVYKISHKITFKEGAFAEPLSCVIHSFKRANISFGGTVVVIGGGPMGLLHLMLAKLKGCKVIVSDLDEGRCKLAENLGADIIVNPLNENFYQKIDDFIRGEIVDGIFVTAGNEEAIKEAFKIGKKLSTIILYGSSHPPIMAGVSSEIHYSENIFTGSNSQTERDFSEAVKILSNRAIDVKPLISEVISLNQIENGFKMKPRGNMQRVVVKL